MPPTSLRPLASICLFAAFADGSQSDPERVRVKEVMEGFGDVNLSEALRRVVLKQTTLEAEVAELGESEELRTLAWEGALAVCESDGMTSPRERDFLDRLATLLRRDLDTAHREVEQADAVTRGATVAAAGAVGGAAAFPGLPAEQPLAVASGSGVPAGMPPLPTDPRSAEVDSTTLRYAILTAAVELLPQNLATMAIIPLQCKLVVGVGKTYGHDLSMASVKELLATVGVGMTGQVLEGYARKLLGKLGGSVLGGIGKTAANWGTGPVMTFATTYAIGQVAKMYYSGGRRLSAIDLRQLYQSQFEQAKGLYARYEPQVRETASRTDPRTLLSSLSGR